MAKRRLNHEGSIYLDKKNKRWIGQISLPNGKRRSKSGKTKKEILNWLTDQRDKIKRGTYVTDDTATVESFITSYMEATAKHNLRPRTFQAHYGYTKNHIIPELGKIKLESLRPDHVQDFYRKKLESGLSARTVQYMHSILHKTLDQALRWGLVTRNVCDLVDSPRPTKKAPELLNVNQINIFLDSVRDHPYYPIYVLAAYTGMRQSEIIGLRTKDVDTDKSVIHVSQTIQWVRGVGFVTAEVKTEKSKRLIELPKTALEVLKKHLDAVEGELVFTSSKGNPVYHQNLYRHFKATLKRLDLPDVKFHSLRHSHATLLLMAGVHPKIVQERLGHSQISTTLDIYSHTIPSMGKEAADKFDKILSL